jgi:hypothetical protein
MWRLTLSQACPFHEKTMLSAAFRAAEVKKTAMLAF